MLQYIITLIIIAIAAGIAIFRFVKFLRNPYSKCDGCAQSCSGCAIDDLKKEISQKQELKKKDNFVL